MFSAIYCKCPYKYCCVLVMCLSTVLHSTYILYTCWKYISATPLIEMWSLPRNGSESEDCQTEDSKHHSNCQEFDYLFIFFFTQLKKWQFPIAFFLQETFELANMHDYNHSTYTHSFRGENCLSRCLSYY